MKTLRILAVAALAASATLAIADEKVITEEGVATFSTFKPAQVRVEVGTTGYGAAVSWSPNPYVGITAGYNGGDISWSDDLEVNGTTYDMDMDNSLAYVNAEIRPFANWFYVAAGVGYIDSTYDLERSVSDSNDVVSIDGTNFYAPTGSGSISGHLNYDDTFAPYLGLGFSPAITSRWGVFGEVGAYYTGNPKVDLQSTGLVAVGGTQTGQDAADNEANKIANDDEYEWLPVAKLGVSFRF